MLSCSVSDQASVTIPTASHHVQTTRAEILKIPTKSAHQKAKPDIHAAVKTDIHGMAGNAFRILVIQEIREIPVTQEIRETRVIPVTPVIRAIQETLATQESFRLYVITTRVTI